MLPLKRSSTVANELKMTAEQEADRATANVSELADTAKERAGNGLDRAADGLRSASDTVRDQAHARADIAADYGERVAEGVERAAEYVRDTDTQAIFSDAAKFIKRYPIAAVAVALLVGLFLGRRLG